MSIIRLTAAQAMVRYLAAQKNDAGEQLIPAAWAIFGHGNVVRAWFAGEIDDAEAVKSMSENYQRLCQIWDKARPAEFGEETG